MPIIITAGIGKSLKAILDNIVTDPTMGSKDLIYPKWCETRNMTDNFVIDQEVAGSLLLQEKPEGAASAVGDIQEGYETRFTARTMSLNLHISEEAIDDAKYDKYINAAKRLMRSAYKTQDLDATNMLIRSTTAGFTGGDGQVLGSASHTLPYGGTFSNIADVYQTPSRAALISANVKIGKYVSNDGLTEGWELKKIVCPLAQKASWEGITGSGQVPESNNNEINVVGPKGSWGGTEIVPVKYWDAASTTAWGGITDCDLGLQWLNRKKTNSRTWVDNDALVMKYNVNYRATRGWTNPRGWYQGNT